MLKNNCHKLLMVFCLLILFSAPGYAADPIQITTWEELDNVRNGLDLDYILMNDLDQTSDGYDTYVGVAGGWSPIGVFVPADIDGLRLGEWDADNSSTPFTGSFNGNGFTISDLIIDRYYEGTNVNDDPPSYDSFGQGLFGYLNDAEVYDLKILNASVSGFRHVGILAGYTRKSTLSDIETSGELYTRHNGGGLVGTIRENTLVQNCSSIADVEGDGVDGGSLRTGGLFGAVHTSTVQDCFTNGTVKGDAMDQGGLAGSIYGTIVGGDDYDKYDKNSYVGSLIIRCHASGTVSGRGAVGGLIGSTNQASVVEDCYTTGEVFATSQEVGGLIGNTNYFSHVIRSYSTSDVTGNGSWVGGLVGIVCNYSVVEQSFATGDVSNGRILTGGLVGHLSTGGVILDSYALGNILGLGGGVGGLVGSVEGVLLNDKTDPSDDEVLGATILRSYSIGSPAGPYSIGGLLGDIREGTVTSSYWDVETSGINDSLRGEGLTTDAMLQQSSYVGWDFGGIWDIEEGNSYPFLVWQGSNQIPYLPNLIAVNDSVEVQEDSVENLIDVLFNDIVLEGDPLEIAEVTVAANGTVVISDNAISYTPDLNYEGFDSFKYTVIGGNGESDSAVVFVRVNNENDPPEAVDDAAEVNWNTSDNVIDVLSNDSDIDDDDVLTVTAVSQGEYGTVGFTETEVTYTPNEAFYGVDSFTYTISDGNEGTDTATVTITVLNGNNPPVAADDTESVNEDSVNNTINVLANDTDSDGNTLVVTGVTEASNGTVTFTATTASYTPDANYTGTDSFTYTISDGHGGTDTAIVNLTVKEKTSSGGSKGGSSVAVPAPEIVVTTGSNLQSTVNSAEISSVINNGSAIADISTDVMDALMDKAEGTGGNEKGDLIEVIVEVDGDIEGIEFNLQSTDLKELLMSSEASFKLSSPFISMTFDYDALKAIDAVNTQGEIVIAASAVMDNELSEADKLLVKDRPVYELTITKGGTKVTSFGEGHVTVVIPYEPKVGEDHEAIVLYYLSDQGVLQLVTGNYDEQLKSVIFETYHFSEFVIGYNPITFTDVKEQAWYKNAVDFVVARGITSGTGANRFEPETQLNRADFVVMLMNAYAPDLEKLSGNQQIGNFDDAGNTYYTDELLTAKRLGLINGTGQNLFEPELEITRQEMMVILHNMLKILGEVPTPFMNLQLSSFNDADQVADWAEVAIVTFVNSGIVVGYNYNLNPEDFMTRAEIAQILFNLLSK